MSTRGAYGFKINKEYKVLYNHFDSYPSGLGRDIVQFLQRSKGHFPELKSKVQKMQAIKKDFENQKNVQDILNQSLWEDPVSVLDSILLGLINLYPCSKKFLEDNLFCEYAYIINFDDDTLDVFARGDLLINRFSLKDIPKDWENKIEKSLKNPMYIEASNQVLRESLVHKHGLPKNTIEKIFSNPIHKKRKKSI